ncbi:hypothetical protein DFH08DRAFT_1051314 [Mycena albidolilacea]|uniref:F-box domain-containing protein n=1 Tax=Mycena albidolilacea TaxID=1033008 RepID=A0AAD7EAP1_9AGAR|nr:hypothetical protein DFH08DRAFT_1051314 [Mycena albidolilacea]
MFSVMAEATPKFFVSFMSSTIIYGAPNRSVDRLATETWEHCCSYCDAQALRRLSLVSPYFRELCQRLLFRRQTVVVPHTTTRTNWITMAKKTHNKAVALKAVAANPRLAKYVREWNYKGGYGLDFRRTWPEIINISVLQDAWELVSTTFAITLGAYTAVTVLQFEDLTINTAVRAALESLESLQELSLSSCEVVARNGIPLPVRVLTLSTIGLPRGTHDSPLHIVAPYNLHRLIIGGSDDAKPLLTALSIQPLPRLVHLSITVTLHIALLFVPFLDVCPHLKHLHVKSDSTFDFSRVRLLLELLPDPLPESMLPMLKSFRGPFPLAGRFVRDRPVVHVRLAESQMEMTEDSVATALVAISRGAVAPGIFATIGSLFPELRSLSLQLKESPRALLDPDASESEDEYEEERDHEIDARIVQLPAGALTFAISDDESSATIPEAHLPLLLPPLPPIQLPGYMYADVIDPPNLERIEPDDDSSPIAIILDLVHIERVVFPPYLQVLHFNQPTWFPSTVFDDEEQHTAVLLLEARLPCLRVVPR